MQVRLRYFPPAGVLGHAMAAFFSPDPKSDMDADLARMKRMIETGRRPRDAVRRGTVAASDPSTPGVAMASDLYRD